MALNKDKTEIEMDKTETEMDKFSLSLSALFLGGNLNLETKERTVKKRQMIGELTRLDLGHWSGSW